MNIIYRLAAGAKKWIFKALRSLCGTRTKYYKRDGRGNKVEIPPPPEWH